MSNCLLNAYLLSTATSLAHATRSINQTS